MKQVLAGLAILTFIANPTFGQSKMENLQIIWPEDYKWKIASNQEDQTVHMIELVPGNERLEKWTIMGTMMSYKGAKNVSMHNAMNMMFDQAKLNAPKAKLTLIEKDEKVNSPWIIFKIEAPAFKDDKNPESQLYYIIQGESSLYSNFIAIKEKTLSDRFVQKWKEIFKASQLVYN